MTRAMPPAPTREAIEQGVAVEGASLDFKQRVDLDSDRGKVKFIDDVVAMLNGGPGYLVIGVAEERGRFRHFEPLASDRDVFERRATQVLLDGIAPRPLKIAMSSIEVDGGFVALLHVPWHGRRAFQNRLTGGFLTRTGARNTPLSREEVQALFTPEEQFARDVEALLSREDARCVERSLMQENGPSLHFAIIPEERYEPGRRSFDRGSGRLRVAPLFHSERGTVFKPCQDGYEALETTFMEGRSITRVFVSYDWSLYVQIAHPFSEENGRVTLHEFGSRFRAFMGELAETLDDDLDGPFFIDVAVRNLRRNPRVGWLFPETDTIRAAPALLDRINDPDFIERFRTSVLRGSGYG